MVGDADQHDDQRPGGQGIQQGLCRLRRAFAANRQYAAMHVKAGNPVHDLAGRHVDRKVHGCFAQGSVEACQPIFEYQHRFGRKAFGPEQHFEHHLSFSDETALPAGKIALADVEISGDARVLRVVDTNGAHACLS